MKLAQQKHMMYVHSDIECDRHNFLSFQIIFCSFTPLLTPKIKIWKNCKKTPEDIILLHLGQPKNSKSVRPPFYEHSPQNFGELESPPSNVPSSKKAKTHFLKKQNILFPTMK